MSSVSSTSTLASWDPMDLFQLVNPDKMAITCVGYAPSCRRRCRNPIAYHNVQAAKAVMGQIVRPEVNNTDLKEMLFNLAEYTLCRRRHQNQATDVSTRWFGLVQRYRDDEEDRASDTSDDDDGSDSDDGSSSTSSSGDDSDNDNAEELRRRFDELETLQREFEELLQRQRRSLQNRLPPSTTRSQMRQLQAGPQPGSTTQERMNQQEAPRDTEQAYQEANHLAEQRAREAAREQRCRDRVQQAKHEETQRQAQRKEEAEADYLTAQRAREAAREQHRLDRAEQAKREEIQRQAHREKEAKAKRLREEQAETARLDRERQAKEKQEKERQQQSRVLSWETAWLRYETAWTEITHNSAYVDTDIRTSQIWPTKNGSFVSCCEEDVRAFFRCQPEDGGRRVLRRQALRWHPDRAARLFTCVADENVVRELLETVTMISQVVISIMGVASR